MLDNFFAFIKGVLWGALMFVIFVIVIAILGGFKPNSEFQNHAAAFFAWGIVASFTMGKPEVNGMHMFYGFLYCPLVRNDLEFLRHKFYRMDSVIKDTGFSFEVMPIEETLKYKVIGDQFRSDVSLGTRGYVIFIHASISNIRCSYNKGESEKNEATPEEAKAFLKQVFCNRILANMKKAVEESLH